MQMCLEQCDAKRKSPVNGIRRSQLQYNNEMAALSTKGHKETRSWSESRIEAMVVAGNKNTGLKSESLGVLASNAFCSRCKPGERQLMDFLDGKRSFTQQPSLELRNSFTVDHLKNAGNSMNSIGTCSLDIGFTGCERKNHNYCSISEQSLGNSTKLESSELGNASLNVNGHRLPSYVGISCAISGYSNYSRFCASTRTSHTSHGHSPTLRSFIIEDSVKRPQNILETTESHKSIASKGLKSISNHSLSAGKCEVVNNDQEKSLVQQKIESLYGKSFASGWRHSRFKHRTSKDDGETSHRSPSCPPEMVHAKVESYKGTSSIFCDRFLCTLSLFLHEFNQQNIFNTSSGAYPQLQSSGCDAKSGEKQEVNNRSKDCTSVVEDSCPIQNISSSKDGNWFLFELNKTCDDIKQMVNEINDFIDRESSQMSEEILGRLLSFVGKANLLLNQKLSQFRDLTMKNINQTQSDEHLTTNEDLEGFWEMVLIQIYEIQSIFKDIMQLKENNWEIKQEAKNVTQPKSRSPRKNCSPKVAKKKSDISTARDEARRNRLKEAKKLQASKMAAHEDVAIFISSSDIKNSEVCSATEKSE
ncbi:Disks large-associated protein 1-like protein [Dinothrombium tinctorium]|uniref:Disks large-associated protein 1-like protein n=1 Tax=Dinothrombium tinctorium TaxID=1965070 RepID=A0A3S4RKZ6_9ACAR|nr:Disks large-associated protein 1-like protein [Dinothrombium tinctorium]RWS17469.1 Disks large-associated protein 1-like protein [Dinothrombium tinctorium]